MINYFVVEKIANGLTITWYKDGEKQVEYYPTNEKAMDRIKDFFTSEKENLEIKSLDYEIEEF